MALHIPSPPVSGIHIGPLFIHVYGLMYVVGITLAIIITRRRWSAKGGDPDLVADVALWSVPAGIIGGRIYFDVTTPKYIPPHWWGPFAVWDGGLGIWGGVALAAVVGIWRLRRHGAERAGFHGCRRARAACGPGHRAHRQLLQPGTVRRPDQPSLGPGDLARATPTRLPRVTPRSIRPSCTS